MSCARDAAKYAEEFYATSSLGHGQCQHFRIKINLVERIPPIAGGSARVENTREVYMLRNTGKPGIVLTRTVSCLCLPCISCEGICEYPEYFQDWEEQCVSVKHPSLLLGTDLWPVNLNSSNTPISHVCVRDESTFIDEAQNSNFDVEVDASNQFEFEDLGDEAQNSNFDVEVDASNQFEFENLGD